MKILHVDDDEDIRTIAEVAFGLRPEVELIQFESGPSAIAEAPDVAPDLFLLDFMMPDMDGEQTLGKLRELPGYDAVPAIFMTAKAEAHMKDKLLQAGALAVVVKPFDPISLADDVLGILDRAKAA